jgi:hypothetical protein
MMEAGLDEMKAPIDTQPRLEMRIVGNADIREVQSPEDEAGRLASGLPTTLSYSKIHSKAPSRQGLGHAAQSR